MQKLKATKVYRMINGTTREHHKEALIYLDKLVGGNTNFDSLSTFEAMNKIISRCSVLLKVQGTWIYNFPLTPQYDVYKDKAHCFEVYSSSLENNIIMLTINGIRFDSRNYDESATKRLQKLWADTKSKQDKAEEKVLKEIQR